MISLVNRTVFITGVGSGIGLSTAILAKSLGARIAGTVIGQKQLSRLMASSSHRFASCAMLPIMRGSPMR